MSTTKNETATAKTVAPAKDNRVEVFVPKGAAGDEPNLLVSVNGKNWLLPKGKTSKVPPAVAYELKRAQRAQERLDEKIDELAAKAQQPAN